MDTRRFLQKYENNAALTYLFILIMSAYLLFLGSYLHTHFLRKLHKHELFRTKTQKLTNKLNFFNIQRHK